MKCSNRMAIFVVIIALIGQGIVPGVILCRGEEGHFAVETTLDRCCSAYVQAPTCPSLFLSLYELESAPDSSCGPCSDTLISTNPCRMPTLEHCSSTSPVEVATIASRGIASQAKTLIVSSVNSTELALIPVKTTFLLL